MKKTLKYAFTFLIIVLIGVLLLTVTSMIPKSKIEENIKESSDFLKNVYGIETVRKHREYTWIYYYSDSDLLDIIYCIDGTHPFTSAMEAKYYDEEQRDVTDDFVTLVEENKEPNAQYMRYWHGTMIILRPLLVFFNIQQIYIINTIVVFSLIIWLMIILIKKSKILAFSFLIGLIMIAIPFVTNCLIYTWTILIMLIFSIILLKVEKKLLNLVNIMFFIVGMLTSYFDFLSTEILTLLVPLLLLVTIRYQEKRMNSLKEGLKLLLITTLLWGIGYVGMWVTKWIIAGVLFHINPIELVKDSITLRLGIDYYGMDTNQIRWEVIIQNIQTLFPIANFKRYIKQILFGIPIAFLVLELIIIDPKQIKKMWFSVILLIIGFIIPLIRFEVLLNHSYNHSFMTFRILLVTVMSFILIIANGLEARQTWINKIFSKRKMKEYNMRK